MSALLLDQWSWPTWRAFVVALCAAALLHAPLFATGLFDFISLMLSAQQVEIVDQDGEAIIPIDLDLMPGEPAAPAPEPTGAPVIDPAATAAKPPPRRLAADAGTDDGGVADAAADAPSDAEPDASGQGPPDAAPDATPGSDVDAGDAGTVVAGMSSDAGPDAEAPKVARAEPSLREPLSVAGDSAKMAGKDPNVQVLISGKRIREHELGAWFGRILTALPQWREFFEGTTIDPIRDFDHMLIAAPQLARDSSKAVVVIDYNVADAEIRKALDAIVARSNPKGEWLKDTPIPAARATAQKAERIFAYMPGRRLLVVLPMEAKSQLKAFKSNKGFNQSSASGIMIHMVTPSRAFRGLAEIPESFKWMRLNVIPGKDGSAEVVLEALDESPVAAVEHGGKLSDTIERVRQFDILGLTKTEIIDRPDFTVEGALIRARVQVSKQQLRRIMSFVEQMMLAKAPGAKGGKFKEPN